MVLFAVPVVRYSPFGHELQPSPGRGHKQRQGRGPAPGHHQGRRRGGVRVTVHCIVYNNVLIITFFIIYELRIILCRCNFSANIVLNNFLCFTIYNYIAEVFMSLQRRRRQPPVPVLYILPE